MFGWLSIFGKGLDFFRTLFAAKEREKDRQAGRNEVNLKTHEKVNKLTGDIIDAQRVSSDSKAGTDKHNRRRRRDPLS